MLGSTSLPQVMRANQSYNHPRSLINESGIGCFVQLKLLTKVMVFVGCHDIQHNDTQHKDTQHNDSQHNDSQHKDTQHNDTQHNDSQHNDTQHNNT